MTIPRISTVIIGALIIGGCASTLQDAASRGDLAEVNELIAAGEYVNVRGDNGWTPIYFALTNYHPEVVEALIMAGADLNNRDEYGQTPLSLAVVYGSVPTAELLIAAGADIDTADAVGRTPLHNAALKGRPEMVELLLWYGADVNPRNQVGWTPLDGAVRHGQTAVYGPLRAAGAIGYSYEVRQGFLEEERRLASPDGPAPARELRGELRTDYDSFNRQTTLSLTFNIETLEGEPSHRQYRSILEAFSETPDKFYRAGKKGWLIGPWQSVSLSTDGKLYPAVRLSFTIRSTAFYFFSNYPVQAKIGEAIEEGSLLEAVSDTGEELVTTRGTFLFSKRQVSRIRAASAVTIRIRFEDKPPLTWDVPGRVLRDWKRFFREAERILG